VPPDLSGCGSFLAPQEPGIGETAERNERGEDQPRQLAPRPVAAAAESRAFAGLTKNGKRNA